MTKCHGNKPKHTSALNTHQHGINGILLTLATAILCIDILVTKNTYKKLKKCYVPVAITDYLTWTPCTGGIRRKQQEWTNQ